MSVAYHLYAVKFGGNVTAYKSKAISVASGDTEFYIDPVSRRLSTRWYINPSYAEAFYMNQGCNLDGRRIDHLYVCGKSLSLSFGLGVARVESHVGPLGIRFEQVCGERYLDSINWYVRQHGMEYDTKLEFTPWVSLRRSIQRVKKDERGVKQPDGSQFDEWWLSPSFPGEKYECFSEVQQRPGVGEADRRND